MELEITASRVIIKAENDSDRELLDKLWLSLGHELNNLEPAECVWYDRGMGELISKVPKQYPEAVQCRVCGSWVNE